MATDKMKIYIHTTHDPKVADEICRRLKELQDKTIRGQWWALRHAWVRFWRAVVDSAKADLLKWRKHGR